MFDVFYNGPKPNLFAFELAATDIQTAANLSRTEFFWFIHGANNYTDFNFSWQPAPWDNEFVHVFPSQWHSNGGVYYASKQSVKPMKLKFQDCQSVKRQVDMSNWVISDNIDVSNFDFSWHPNPLEPAYEYHFPTQHQRAGGPVYKGSAGVKYINTQVVKSLVDMNNWIVPSTLDISEFDFSWHPNPLEPAYEYHFPTQHQRDGGPIYKGSAGIKYVTLQKGKSKSSQIFYIDFFNAQSDTQFNHLQNYYEDIKRIRYVDNHLNVFKRIINLATSEFIWITSSVCDYIGSNFDFTWHPEKSQREMIHCFASGNQKRGDTFFIHVESFRQQMYNLDILDWFNVIHYVKDITVNRFEWPVLKYNSDNLVEEIKNHQFNTPYTLFTNQSDCYPNFYPCLWSEKDRIVESFTNSKAICCVPRDAKAYVKTQIYDYPHISDNKYKSYFAEMPLDIVYISNGEPNEQEYFDWLQYETLANFHIRQIHWIRGVNGRDQAYKAAATASTTPWFFAVFAKLRVDPEFNFKWQPDYFQGPKHYIFHAKNPLNELEYGHQAIIAYNKQLVLNTTETGLDFTLSAVHEVVPILSGVAEFNQDPWMTWRTAFREVIKLKKFTEESTSIENSYRLKKWLTVAQGKHAEWCLRGANDAVEYYEKVFGNFEKLKLSYEWSWLKQYFENKY